MMPVAWLPTRWIGCMLLVLLLAGCAFNGSEEPARKSFEFKSVAKTDLGSVIEFHVENMRQMLGELMVKLYRRNPRELAKSDIPDFQTNRERLFSRTENFDFPELQSRTGAEAVQLALSKEYKGDRVFAFVAGLTDMVMASYEYQMEFYLFDTVDPQKLYNSARNIEIAVWKIEHDRDSNGELFILTNSMPGEIRNLSYERLFGKLIATQDNLAEIMANKQNRIIKRVMQKMATAVFLPI